MTSDERADGRIRRLVRSLRFRVVWVATLVALLVLVGAGTGVVIAHERVLTENLDDTIERRVDELAAVVADGSVPSTISASGDVDDSLAQVVSPAGDVIASSPNIRGRPSVADGPPPGRDEVRRTIDDLPIEDGPFRLLSRRVPGRDGIAIVHAAASLEDVHESTDALITSLVVALPVVALLLAALVWWLVGRTLRPVEAIRAEVADIGGADLHRRVPEPPSGDEIARLARTMNAMLDRVEDAMQRQQRFVADASHELRSPLTRIRTEIEVDAAHPERRDLAATHRSIGEEVIGLQRLVDDLLHFARSDAGGAPVRRAPVDVDDIVLRQVDRLRRDGRVVVDLAGVTAAQVRGDVDQLTRVVANLLDNGARHAASTVTLTLEERGDVAVFTVADDGPGIPPSQHERVFDRFTRLDDARVSSTGGAGLGLAIARDIVQRHGGTIAVDPDHHRGARFVVTLPLGDPSAARVRPRLGSPPEV